ncbi:MAG: isoaspartyl peptidase/L-asparaginase [Candidatus Riflebacteria bacterium]|nr:isoaspartyl peptidase/L-asparaginase [Candidatus Riflebacteria bacterium]
MISLIVHGGAWDIPDDAVDAHFAGVKKSVMSGWEFLKSGGSALDCVELTIRILEDDSTFDAGRGSFLNAAGEIELDSSIMDGTNLKAGAVAAVRNILHPISLARAVLEKSDCVLLAGTGAERFAMQNGISCCSPEELLVGRELARWHELKKNPDFKPKSAFSSSEGKYRDTVGAVAFDSHGNIAAGTSTGGIPMKIPGRVGDAPLPGCGTYADNAVGGVSCTGWGESIIRVALAKTVVDALERFSGDARKAVEFGIDRLARKVNGLGGAIVLNSTGEPACHFNTPRMARAWMNDSLHAPVCMV